MSVLIRKCYQGKRKKIYMETDLEYNYGGN